MAKLALITPSVKMSGESPSLADSCTITKIPTGPVSESRAGMVLVTIR